MKKLPIPQPLIESPEVMRRYALAVKDNLDVLTGARGRITPLASTATTAETIAKINEIITRLQA